MVELRLKPNIKRLIASGKLEIKEFSEHLTIKAPIVTVPNYTDQEIINIKINSLISLLPSSTTFSP